MAGPTCIELGVDLVRVRIKLQVLLVRIKKASKHVGMNLLIIQVMDHVLY